MAGLDPAIHAVTLAPMPKVSTYGTPWMPGSSPGMTLWGKLQHQRIQITGALGNSMAKEFAGKSVLITGAASGIGKAAAYRWAEEGAKVCIADMDIPRAQKVAEDIRSKGGDVFATKIDVSSQQDNDRMVAETVER